MRYFSYIEPDLDNLDNTKMIVLSEDDIMKTYWLYWKGKMDKKYGENHELTTKENCIDDWCVVNWAWCVDNWAKEIK